MQGSRCSREEWKLWTDRHAEDFIFQEKNPVDVLKALSDQTESVLDKGVEKRLESDDAVYSW